MIFDTMAVSKYTVNLITPRVMGETYKTVIFLRISQLTFLIDSTSMPYIWKIL